MITNELADFIWINGKSVSWNESQVHILTHSLHYSAAVFEGIRAYQGKIFKLKEHTDRLLRSAQYMGIEVHYTAEQINEATENLIAKNRLFDAYIRPLIWRGAESMNIYTPKLSNNIMIAAVPSRNEFTTKLKLNIGKWRKPNPLAMPPQAKSSTHYGMQVVCQRDALQQGYDDSLILDDEGFVAECTVANVFFGKGNKLVTPIADRFLNGITRQTVMTMAANLGFAVEESRISLEDLANYDYCFITGTAREIGGIVSISLNDVKELSFPDPEKKVELLQAEFAELVGK